MSIAASVVVQPSRGLLALVGGLCLGILALGMALVCGEIVDLTIIARLFWAFFCWLLGGIGFVIAYRKRRIYHLDISGTGQIRLRASRADSIHLAGTTEKSAGDDGILVTLLADSTIWPGFLMLRLKTGDGLLYNVPILPDSLSQDAFRAVSVACRWIAGHEFKE